MLLVYWATGWMNWIWISWFGATLRAVSVGYFSAGVVFAFLFKFNVFK